jgi:hypothetical protein
MRFARFTFIAAGIWGLAVLLPFYALVDVTGRHYAAPTEYPQFFYGFFAVALAWQLAFLLIGSNPARYRALMPLGVVEKLGWVVTLAMLHRQGRVAAIDVQALWPDLVLGLLFIAAFVATRPART